MTKRSITYLLLSIALAVYAVIAVSASRHMAAAAPCTGVDIEVYGQEGLPFVTPEDIDIELGGISARADSMKMADFNLTLLESRLNALPNIERANCLRTTNDRLLIQIHPMKPVARIFDGNASYYINRDGKRLTANSRYRVDVPVITGRFDSIITPLPVLPLIDIIESNDSWRSLVAAYEVTPAGDILLVPSVTGHVVNFGDGSDAEAKFRRLRSFYAQVMPVKGWNYYDTVSVKFSGQVVAKVAPGKRLRPVEEYTEDDFDETIHPMEETPDDAAQDNSTAIPTIN